MGSISFFWKRFADHRFSIMAFEPIQVKQVFVESMLLVYDEMYFLLLSWRSSILPLF